MSHGEVIIITIIVLAFVWFCVTAEVIGKAIDRAKAEIIEEIRKQL